MPEKQVEKAIDVFHNLVPFVKVEMHKEMFLNDRNKVLLMNSSQNSKRLNLHFFFFVLYCVKCKNVRTKQKMNWQKVIEIEKKIF